MTCGGETLIIEKGAYGNVRLDGFGGADCSAARADFQATGR
jgi:hypothetical protein